MLKTLSRILLIVLTTLAAATVLPVLLLRWLPPPTTSFMLQSPVRPVQYRWVPADRIADVARKAVVASEDQRFWTHRGFDLEAMQKAYESNRRHRKIRGGSTISQQTAKNLFLWQGGGYARKAIEAYFTVLIESLWPKQRILEVYLNVAEFGAGVYGVEAASRAYLGKSASQLSAADAARLIAVLPSPRRWHAAAPGPYVQSRVAWILRQIGYGGKIEDDEEPEPPAGDAPAAAADEQQGAPEPEAAEPAPTSDSQDAAAPQAPPDGDQTAPAN